MVTRIDDCTNNGEVLVTVEINLPADTFPFTVSLSANTEVPIPTFESKF